MDKHTMADPDGAGTWTTDQRLATLEQLLAICVPDLVTVIDQASFVLLKVLDVDLVDIYRYDRSGDALVTIGTAITPLAHRQQALGLDRLPLAGGGRLVTVFRTGTTYRTGRAREDTEILEGFTAVLGLRSLLAVPFMAGGARAGVLRVASTRPDRFSEEDQQFLETVAHWVGLVVERVDRTTHGAVGDAPPSRQRAAEELIAVLAHDLRAFLAPLAMRLDLLGRRASRDTRPRDQRDATAGRQALDRLERLIGTLLDAERLDRGLFSLAPQSVDLAALARETAVLLATETFPITVRAPETLTVRADPDALRQALENLLSNALKHSPPGVPVELLVATEQRAGEEWAAVTVRDRGSGIPPETLPRLFERFAVGPGSQGLGLGLYLASRIAAAHGGTLTVDSTPGAGARFQLAWPLIAPTGEGAVVSVDHAGPGRDRGGPLIAAVNDDALYLDVLHDALTEEGYQVRLYRSGSGAYHALREAPPDLIILDIQLEHATAGWQLLEMLRLDPTLLPIPVIVCSADIAFLRTKADHLWERGCAILEKPFTLADLLGQIGTLLRRTGSLQQD